MQHHATPRNTMQQPCNNHATTMQQPCNNHATAMQQPCNNVQHQTQAHTSSVAIIGVVGVGVGAASIFDASCATAN
jgi:hypothetical protein